MKLSVNHQSLQKGGCHLKFVSHIFQMPADQSLLVIIKKTTKNTSIIILYNEK